MLPYEGGGVAFLVPPRKKLKQETCINVFNVCVNGRRAKSAHVVAYCISGASLKSRQDTGGKLGWESPLAKVADTR